MIALERVSIRLGQRAALDDVSFAAARGEVVGLVGPNGAGKTTALRVLSGYLVPDVGVARVAGYDIARQRIAALGRLGYLPEAVPLYGDMRVDELLTYRARLKGVAADVRAARVAEVIERFGLGERRRSVIARLSKGLRQRVGLADALLARPEVLLLDEPTTGLDPGQLVQLRSLLVELAREHTIVVSSHALGELAEIAARWVVLADGRVVGDGTPAELRQRAELDADAPLERVFLALVTPRESA